MVFFEDGFTREDEEQFNDYFEGLCLNCSCIEEVAAKLTEKDILTISYITDWDEEELLKEDKRNTIYLYALQLLFLSEDRHNLFDFLHCLNPYLK